MSAAQSTLSELSVTTLLKRLFCAALSLVLALSFLLLSLAYPKKSYAFAPIVIGGGAVAAGAEFSQVAAAIAAIVAASSGIALGAGAVQDFSPDWYSWYGKDSTAEDWTAQDWQNINAAHLCEVIGIGITNASGQMPPDPDFEPNEDYEKLAKVIQGVLTMGAAGADDMVDAVPGVLDWLFGSENPAIVSSFFPHTVNVSGTDYVINVDPDISLSEYGFTGSCPSGYQIDVITYHRSGDVNWVEAWPDDLVISSTDFDSRYQRIVFSYPSNTTHYYQQCYSPGNSSGWRSTTGVSYTWTYPVGSDSSPHGDVISPRFAAALDSSFSPSEQINDSLPLLSDPESITGYIGQAIADLVGATQTAQQYWQNIMNNAGQVPDGAVEPSPYKIVGPLQQPITHDTPYSDVVRDTDQDPTPDPDPGHDPTNPDDPTPDPVYPPVPIDHDELEGLSSDLLGLFPFCLPHDLHYITSRLVAVSAAPRFTWVFDFSAFGVGRHELVVDLSDYADVARIIRFMLLVSFMVGWILLLVRTKPWDIGT